jgi:hypothetical protein
VQCREEKNDLHILNHENKNVPAAIVILQNLMVMVMFVSAVTANMRLSVTSFGVRASVR